MPRKDVTRTARYTTSLICICRRILSTCHVPSHILSWHNCRNEYSRNACNGSESQYHTEFGQNNHDILYITYDIIIQFFLAPPLHGDITITYIPRSIWAQLDSPLVCRNICTRLYTRTLVSGSHYAAGGKYCIRCEFYFVTTELFCECCGMRLRASPANGEYKEKVRAKKNGLAESLWS